MSLPDGYRVVSFLSGAADLMAGPIKISGGDSAELRIVLSPEHKPVKRLHIHPVAIDDSQAIWREAFEWLRKYGDHDPDWADACLAVLCGRESTCKIWTYDVEFRTIWRKPNGARIPLAVRS